MTISATRASGPFDAAPKIVIRDDAQGADCLSTFEQPVRIDRPSAYWTEPAQLEGTFEFSGQVLRLDKSGTGEYTLIIRTLASAGSSPVEIARFALTDVGAFRFSIDAARIPSDAARFSAGIEMSGEPTCLDYSLYFSHRSIA